MGATKYIFVTGGVLSGLGKGITAASLGTILKNRKLRVNIQKCDPYLNVDAGTLNPAEHGECFVTQDGAETDLDLGHYERFLDVELSQVSSLMSGRVLQKVIADERKGKYLGKTVQIIPHVTNTIQDEIEKAGQGFDVHIVEIGGTVGDYEGLSFIEAIREFSTRVGRANCLYVHLVYMPYLGASKEIKTKPAQNATRDLRGLGIVPDVLVARSELPAPSAIKKKLALYTGVEERAIALLPNASSVYEVPLSLESAGIGKYIVERFDLKAGRPNLRNWRNVVTQANKDHKSSVTVGVVAKYMDNEDTYMSVFEALKSAAFKHDVGLSIEWIDAEKLDGGGRIPKRLKKVDGIVVPGGFGRRGIEGKIIAAQYALKRKVPYLGLCLGLQVGVVAVARQAGLKLANTVEVDENTPDPIIHIMPGQEQLWGTGGTMRLGNYPCKLARGTLARELYGRASIVERHRHRYEVNNDYRRLLTENGLILSGLSPDGQLVEIIEMRKKHPFFLASQFHPEFKSRPSRPHPMFDGFIATLKKRS
jgi:CTP synthase